MAMPYLNTFVSVQPSIQSNQRTIQPTDSPSIYLSVHTSNNPSIYLTSIIYHYNTSSSSYNNSNVYFFFFYKSNETNINLIFWSWIRLNFNHFHWPDFILFPTKYIHYNSFTSYYILKKNRKIKYVLCILRIFICIQIHIYRFMNIYKFKNYFNFK